MILRKIRLENFGLYAGVNELNLVPRRRQGRSSPIVLIGGKNGAGKTTLLEAVRLALYGRRSLGARVGQVEYDDYLRGRVHREGSGNSAAVTLEFDYAESGAVNRYRVKRQWDVRGSKVVESLQLEKGDAVIEGVPRDEWHNFLQELVPPGVSQLFFFDGEKIREIADGEEDDEQLAEAVRGLLGIELVSRLRTDLGLYLSRHQRTDGAKTAAHLETTLREIATLEKRAKDLAEDVGELTSARDSQARAAEQIRRRFVAEGGDAAARRGKIEAEREEVKRLIARGEHELRDLANKLLPFAVAPRAVASFREALAPSGSREQFASFETFRASLLGWRATGEPLRSANWSPKHWADLEAFLEHVTLGRTAEARNCPALREVGDGATAARRLQEVEEVTRPRSLELLAELDALAVRLRDIEAELTRADSAASGLLLDELLLAEQRVGATEATLKARQEELKVVRGQIFTLDRERRKALEDQAADAATAERAGLAARSAQALAEYEQRLLEHKLQQLRVEFVRRFNHLARKGDLIVDVRIDPTTFAATLIGKGGEEIPKAALSAGEKQIYAIAMLWALARTSGRPLPMIIDTPLGRLDSEHRTNLIERYFPAASHQVILLSTDTEVDERLLKDLGDSVSHSYRLDYDPLEKRTYVESGYFEMTSESGGQARALQQA